MRCVVPRLEKEWVNESNKGFYRQKKKGTR